MNTGNASSMGVDGRMSMSKGFRNRNTTIAPPTTDDLKDGLNK